MDIAARNSGNSRGGNIAFPVCQPDNQCTYEEITKSPDFSGLFVYFFFMKTILRQEIKNFIIIKFSPAFY